MGRGNMTADGSLGLIGKRVHLSLGIFKLIFWKNAQKTTADLLSDPVILHNHLGADSGWETKLRESNPD